MKAIERKLKGAGAPSYFDEVGEVFASSASRNPPAFQSSR